MIDRPSPTSGTLLALHGDLPSPAFLLSLREHYTAIVAADGAALALRDCGIKADVVIGDLDGIGGEREALEREGMIVVDEPDQESGDLEKSLLWIIGRGESRIDIVGVSGGMTDHVLGNFSVLARFASRVALRILEERSITYLVTTRIELATSPGDRVSLLPLPSARVATSGLRWKLEHERLGMGEREGGSNEAVGEKVVVDVAEGVLGVMHYRG